MTSIFQNSEITPSPKDLKKALGSTFSIWQILADYTKHLYPQAIEIWDFSSPKYGWSFKIKDKKRVILYLLPRDKFFKVAFVFGQKATDNILKADISDVIKTALQEAAIYAEGRGIRIDVSNNKLTEDLKKLIAIKISG